MPLKRNLLIMPLLSVLGAIAHMLAFPLWDQWWCGLVCLIPLLELIRRSSGPVNAFTWVLLSSTAAWALTLYWIYVMVAFNTGSSLQAGICLIALSAYCALYSAGWAALLRSGWGKLPRAAMACLVVAGWVSAEFLRSHLITGFPWALLGTSQWNNVPVLQWAEFGGVYGVSALAAGANVMLFGVIARRRFTPVNLVVLVASSALIVAGGAALGRRSATSSSGPGDILIAGVQGNIDQYKKWDAQYEQDIRATYTTLSVTLTEQKPDLVVWPETAVPGFVPLNEGLRQWLVSVSKSTGLWMLVGTPYSEHADHGANAVVVVSPDHGIVGKHLKTHLVPFGEYVPLRKYLQPFFGILNALGDFDRGSALTPLDVNGIAVGTTICSENFFPEKAAALARNGAVLITNHTNDGWFLQTAASQQHFIMNIFRAVETRRPVFVCANTGVSGSIRADGSLDTIIGQHKETAYSCRVHPSRQITWYVRWGDWLAYLCMAATIVVAGFIFLTTRRSRRFS